MNDVWYDPVPEAKDPCNKNCGVSSSTGLCLGCFRTLDEIADWDSMSKDEQIVVLDKIKERRTKGRERDWSLLPNNRRKLGED